MSLVQNKIQYWINALNNIIIKLLATFGGPWTLASAASPAGVLEATNS